MMQRFSLTAVMLTCDRPERCRETAACNARALSTAEHPELLILNNGHQPVELPNHLAGVPVRVISMRRNLGAEARNAALDEARSDRLFFLDDDVYIEPAHVAALDAVFSAYPDTGAVGFRIFNRDQEEGSLLPAVFHGCAAGISREALRQAGGYPRGYRYYAEEYHVSFRLRQLGYTLRLAETEQPVQHVRDPGGRSKDHIVYRLVRNNTRLFTAFLPRSFLSDAFRDMLQRYRLVAVKEHAEQGFRQGLLALPWALARGLTERRPLTDILFAETAMLPDLDDTIRDIRNAGIAHVVFCGVGRFPTLWAKRLKSFGLKTLAFLDGNPCWKGRFIRGIPVYQDAGILMQQAFRIPIVFLSGLSSLPETGAWNSFFMNRGFIHLQEAKHAPAAEKDTRPKAPFLCGITGIKAWHSPISI